MGNKKYFSIIKKLTERGSIEYPIHLNIKLLIKAAAFESGIVRVHIPVPIDVTQLREGQLLDTEPVFRLVSVENYPQRTAFFDERLEENTPFMIEMAFTNGLSYIRPDKQRVDSEEQVSFTEEQLEKHKALHSCGCESYGGDMADRVMVSDIAEEAGISFSEQEKVIAERLIKDCNSYYDKIHGIYKYCTSDGYEMKESRNVAFVKLCRISGIPARWQGGLVLLPDEEDYESFIGDSGSYTADRGVFGHDWAMVHMNPYGWVFIDCEFGAEARRLKDDSMTDFFFGNIDPFRMPTASGYCRNLYPAKDYERCDGRTNYHGEIEYSTRGLRKDEFISIATVYRSPETDSCGI